MEGSSLPSPKFSSPNEGESQDFLGFSSTPIPGKNFKPKWGKKNRNQNWNRFGNFNEGPSPGQEAGHHNSPHPNNQYQNSQHHGNQHHQNSPHVNHHHQNSPHHRGHFHMRGSPRQYTPSPRGRGNYQNTPNGGRGNYQNTPNGGRGNYQNSFGGGRGSFNNSPARGRGGFQNSPLAGQGGGYFSPAMLRNPWADLEWTRDRKRENDAGAEGNEEETVIQGNVEESEENNEADRSNNVMSDSMIPQVGESLLERNNDITSVDDDLVTADDGGEKDERNNAEDI